MTKNFEKIFTDNQKFAKKVSSANMRKKVGKNLSSVTTNFSRQLIFVKNRISCKSLVHIFLLQFASQAFVTASYLL